jgi:hypothetical protein
VVSAKDGHAGQLSGSIALKVRRRDKRHTKHLKGIRCVSYILEILLQQITVLALAESFQRSHTVCDLLEQQ